MLSCQINSWNFTSLNKVFRDLCPCSSQWHLLGRVMAATFKEKVHRVCWDCLWQTATLFFYKKTVISYSFVRCFKFCETLLCQIRIWSLWTSLLFFLVKIRALVSWSESLDCQITETICTEPILFQKSHHGWAVPKSLEPSEAFLAAHGKWDAYS